MVEFGEKLKQIREEKGLTQQSLAEKLYVTRQAVSRWECGARYPDLLTAKKIATILNTSLDELLSGEELKENIEREPVLGQPIQNIVQTVLYAMATIIYLLLCIFSIYSYIRPNEALQGTPAGEITMLTVYADIMRILYFAAAAAGFFLSVKNKLNAKITGCIMCVPYGLAAVRFVVTYIDMQIRDNGHISPLSWLTEFGVTLLFALTILLFFGLRERRIPLQAILCISLLTMVYLADVYKDRFLYFTDLGFVVTTVHMVGKMGMAVLLGYQAWVWDRKMKAAYK